ncbi:hypothetical protein B0H11DRAFT_1969705 [Mycena galericulata]|nr:hypothetical protein B0H11DRAFT_1969705 [Mycena galericulata]
MTVPLSSPGIPQELVDLIVDNLQGDVPTLKSCSLAPPTPGSSDASPSQRFHTILSSSPHLAPYVKELHIVLVGSETSFDYNSDGEYLVERHVPWVMSGRTLSLVLPLLNLKRISLVENAPGEWNAFGDFSMNWNKLGRTLKAALVAVFSSPTLESVHLRGIVIDSPFRLLSLFSEATSLKEMSISRVYFTQHWDRRDSWPESKPWHPRLRSLLVSDVFSHSLCRYFLNPNIDLTRIASLTVASESEQWTKALVEAAMSNAVQNLRLYRPPSALLKFAITANLRSLHVRTREMSRLIPVAFTAFPRDSCLETIVFEGPANLVGSHYLNATIETAMVHLRALKEVEIRAFLWYDLSPSFHEWSAGLHVSLPSLVERGMLTVTEIQIADRGVLHGWE